MSSLNIGVDIITTFDQWERGILGEIRKAFNQAISLSLVAIKDGMGDIIQDAIESSPEYIALVGGGRLQGELGVASPSRDFIDIFRAIRSQVLVEHNTVRVSGSQLTGGLTISFIREDHKDILGLASAHYDSNGHDIRWLEWLLTKGSNVIITGYKFTTNRINSRTGLGTMRKNGSWHVPAQFAGVVGNNFITRACGTSLVEQRISDLIEKEVGGRL